MLLETVLAQCFRNFFGGLFFFFFLNYLNYHFLKGYKSIQRYHFSYPYFYTFCSLSQECCTGFVLTELIQVCVCVCVCVRERERERERERGREMLSLSLNIFLRISSNIKFYILMNLVSVS